LPAYQHINNLKSSSGSISQRWQHISCLPVSKNCPPTALLLPKNYPDLFGHKVSDYFRPGTLNVLKKIDLARMFPFDLARVILGNSTRQIWF
jgi:hypothetical protein